MASLCWSWICAKYMKRFLSCFSVFWCTLLLCERLCAVWRLLKLDLTLTHSLFFLSLSLSKSGEQALRSLKAALWRANWVLFWFFLVFFAVWKERRLFSSLCLTSQCFGVSLIEGMLSFTSFLYSISWFPVHAEAHGCSVWEAFSRWCVRNNLSHSESAVHNPVSWKTRQQWA